MNQVIVSANTMRALLEAHASMAAWYYQMSAALHEAGTPVAAPNDVQRRAHLAAVADEFPELTALAKSIHMPRAYVPRPAVPVASSVVENEGVAVSAPPASYVPTPAMLQEEAPLSATPNSNERSVEPPAMVNPLTVKYEDS